MEHQNTDLGNLGQNNSRIFDTIDGLRSVVGSFTVSEVLLAMDQTFQEILLHWFGSSHSRSSCRQSGAPSSTRGLVIRIKLSLPGLDVIIRYSMYYSICYQL